MKYTENLITNALKEEGIDAEQVTVMKNGIPCKGIRICNTGDPVCPVVYYSEQETADEFLRRVRFAIMAKKPSFDLNRLISWPYVREHVFLSIQKRSIDDGMVKKNYLNLEVIMRVKFDMDDDKSGSVKISNALLSKLGIPEKKLWEAAMNNTGHNVTVRSMAELLGFSISEEELLYVASAGLIGGASVLCFPEVFRHFCEEHGENRCCILPSSTEEVILLPWTDLGSSLSVRDLAEMVSVINRDQVDPLIQLDPVVYFYDMDTNDVRIADTI